MDYGAMGKNYYIGALAGANNVSSLVVMSKGILSKDELETLVVLVSEEKFRSLLYTLVTWFQNQTLNHTLTVQDSVTGSALGHLQVQKPFRNFKDDYLAVTD